MKMNKETAALSIMIVGEASGVFAGFCPSWFTVASPFFHEQEAKDGNVKRIRWGEAAATVIVMLTGYGVYMVTGNWTPFWVSAFICAIFIGGYEYMIANPSAEDE